MQPTFKIEILDSLDGEEKEKRDKAIKNNIHNVTLKDEAGQTNDILTITALDNGAFDKLAPKTKIGLLIGYSLPKSSEAPKNIEALMAVTDNATKIKDFIKNQALGIAHNVAGKHIPNFLVSAEDGVLTGQTPSADTTLEAEERDSVFYSLGTFSVNKITKTKQPGKREITIQAITISTIDNMKTSKTRNFKGSTLEDVASTIAIETGLTLAIHPDVADAPIDLPQTGQTNQSYLRQLCEKHNASFKVVDSTLMINHRDATTKIGGTALPEIVLNDSEDIISYTYEVSNYNQAVTGLIASYWNEAGDEKLQIFVGNESGAVLPLATAYTDEEIARREATAQLAQLSGGKKTLTITTDGRKLLVPDSKFKIVSDQDTLLDGHRFKVTVANYSFTNGNLRVSYNCDKL